MGERQKNIKLALSLLAKGNEVKIEKSSMLYETEPQDCPPGSPRFLNSAVKIKTNLSPQELFRKIKDIETEIGRPAVRKRCFPRPIDLDILFYGNKKVNSPYLKIPHPRLRMRDFVLRPLKEVAPEIVKSLSKETKIITDISVMREIINREKSRNKKIGFVPTMGCLHEGHLSLIRQAKKDCDISVVSIFVNPIQFAPKEDYKKYPRDLEIDSILAKSAGCDLLFYPEPQKMYPSDYLTYVNVEKISEGLCGEFRPGHFKGVATVVEKLFNIIQPDIAYFGQKDYQQALIIKRMVKDLNMPLRIKVMPIVRAADGLALSSRNVYLNTQKREDALILYTALQKAKEMILKGEKDSQKVIAKIKEDISKIKSARIDYIAFVDAETLEPAIKINGRILAALAVWIGKTRLIDNNIIG